MAMTVAELHQILDEWVTTHPDAPVLIAEQPNWPFEYNISRAELVLDGDDLRVYLAEGDQIGYLPGDISRDLGWR